MYGTYIIDHGIYKLSLQDVIRKDFIFNPGGTIVFGGPPIQADLNLQAVYTVPSVSLNDLSARSTFSQNNVRVNCLMNLGGKAQSPQISFDFDLPNVNEDEKQMVRSLISTEEEKKHAGDLPPRHRAFLHLRLQQHGTKPILRGHEVIVVLYSERATQPDAFHAARQQQQLEHRDEPQHGRNGMERHGRRRTALRTAAQQPPAHQRKISVIGITAPIRTVTSSATSTYSGC